MQVFVNAGYSTSSNCQVELPIESWDQVESWFVKWGRFFYKIKGQEEFKEVYMESDDLIENMDLKRPIWVEIYPTYEDDQTPDYDNQLDQTS